PCAASVFLSHRHPLSNPYLTPMSEAAVSTPTSTPVVRHTLVGWLGAVGLAVLFSASLIYYPPLADASKAMDTPTWVKFLGRFHVVALHLPVGVLVLAAILEVGIILRHKASEAIVH